MLGFGTGDNAGLMVSAPLAEQRRAVDVAIDAGVNYFDTSPDYGRGRAEENLGRALKGRRSSVIVTSKVEIMPADRHRIAKRVVDSVEASLRRLQMDYLDIVEIHNHPGRAHEWERTTWTPLLEEDFTAEGGAFEGLARVLKDGKVRLGGIACEEADPVIVSRLVANPLVSVLNVWLNMLNPSSLLDNDGATVNGPADYRGIATAAKKNGAGIAGFRAMGGGALMSAAARTFERHPYAGGGFTRNPAQYRREVELAQKLVTRLEIGSTAEMAALAYRFNITDPRITTTVAGFSELSHLQGALDAVAKGPLESDKMAEIIQIWNELFLTDANDKGQRKS